VSAMQQVRLSGRGSTSSGEEGTATHIVQSADSSEHRTPHPGRDTDAVAVLLLPQFHAGCFTCHDCNTRLNSTTLCDSKEEIYCSACYAKNFGPKGFGIGGLSVHTGQSVADTGCHACGAKDQTSKFCNQCGKPTAAPSASPPAPAPAAAASSSVVKPSSLPKASGSAVVTLGGGDKCAACHKTVYAAERIQAGSQLFHDNCLSCSVCHHAVSSVNMNDRDGKLFCQPCYAKQYGPKGYGFAGGAAGLMSQ
jgi:cysteine/glycine-rich protein